MKTIISLNITTQNGDKTVILDDIGYIPRIGEDIELSAKERDNAGITDPVYRYRVTEILHTIKENLYEITIYAG